MKSIFHGLAIALVLTVVAAFPARSADSPNVYFFRGFLNIWSTGFDQMAEELRARGIKVRVLGHTSTGTARREILAGGTSRRPGTRPLVLVGHSLGGNAAMALAKSLTGENVSVNLVMTLDPTRSGPLSTNVRRYVNYNFSGSPLRAGVGVPASVTRRVTNINVRNHAATADEQFGHFSMTTNRKLMDEIIRHIRRAL